jgi:hypothetical protein
MPKRLVKKGVTVVREGRRIRPEINKGFDFTKEEIDAITETDPTVLGSAKDAEAVEDGTAEVASTSTATSSAEGSQAAAKGGKKTSTANKSDAEAKTDDDL